MRGNWPLWFPVVSRGFPWSPVAARGMLREDNKHRPPPPSTTTHHQPSPTTTTIHYQLPLPPTTTTDRHPSPRPATTDKHNIKVEWLIETLLIKYEIIYDIRKTTGMNKISQYRSDSSGGSRVAAGYTLFGIYQSIHLAYRI